MSKRLYDMMSLEEMRKHEWHVSWSGGKDSTATIILMHELSVPISKITYIRMMYNNETAATLPIMTTFVDNSVSTLKNWGYDVEICPSLLTAEEQANTVFKNSKYPYRNGKKYGIVNFCRGRCGFTKVKQNTIKKNQQKNSFEMIGYGADETERLVRLGGKRQSILATLGIPEEDCFFICRQYNLLSPLYDLGIKRDGCFFCPNAAKREREMLHKTRPDLIKEIYKIIEMTEFPCSKVPNNWIKDYLDHGEKLRTEQLQ